MYKYLMSKAINKAKLHLQNFSNILNIYFLSINECPQLIYEIRFIKVYSWPSVMYSNINLFCFVEVGASW